MRSYRTWRAIGLATESLVFVWLTALCALAAWNELIATAWFDGALDLIAAAVGSAVVRTLLSKVRNLDNDLRVRDAHKKLRRQLAMAAGQATSDQTDAGDEPTQVTVRPGRLFLWKRFHQVFVTEVVHARTRIETTYLVVRKPKVAKRIRELQVDDEGHCALSTIPTPEHADSGGL